MKVSKIKIKRVIPNDGLVGFASCVLNDVIYLGNIAIFRRLSDPSRIRLVFPVKELDNEHKISLFYPLTRDFYLLLESEIETKFKEND